MTLESDAKFEKKLILGSKNGLRNLVNFTQPLRSLKISFGWAIFVQSVSGLS